jgi:hypothetical protein
MPIALPSRYFTVTVPMGVPLPQRDSSFQKKEPVIKRPKTERPIAF